MKIIPLYLEAHPINGFSHRSFVSKSTLHFLMLCVPLCIAVRLGKYIIAFRSLTCSNGTPATRFNLFWKKNWMVCAIDHVPRRIQCLMKNAISSDLYILIWTFKCTFWETYLKIYINALSTVSQGFYQHFKKTPQHSNKIQISGT